MRSHSSSSALKRVSLLLILISSGCWAQTEADEIFRAKADSLFLRGIDPAGPGCSIFIQIGGRRLYEGSAGYADLKKRERFTERTVSNLGSISKTFVAYGILQLMKEGKLSLDDSIIKYFPDFKNSEIARKVRIRHLLTHTSGLPDCRNVEGDSLFFLTANDEENFAPLKRTDTLEFEPGTRWNYSNPAFNALALIIEKVSGMKWQKFIERNIFVPAGMSDSRITDYAYPSEGVAHAYRLVNGRYEEYDYGEYPTFNAAGNGGVWSSVSDLRKYYDAMRRAAFLDSATIRLSQTLWHPENWSDTIPPNNGFSWFVGDGRIFHTGHQAGFAALFMMIPAKDFLLIFECNAQELDEVQAKILELLSRSGYL